MFKTTREYAEALLQGNRERHLEDTVRAAKKSAVEASKIYPQTPASFWVDVIAHIDVLVDEAMNEAQMGYRDANGIEHESYTDACIYYGADTPDMIRQEMADRAAEDCIEQQDAMEARGGPVFYVPCDEIPF